MTQKGLWASSLAIVLALSLSGCATLFGSSSQTVTFESEPSNAKYQYGAFSGRTPGSVAVPRGNQPNFAIFKLEGYEEKTVPVETGIQGVTWLDILFWPGFIVDFASGNAYTIKTPLVRGMLEPVAQTALPSQGAPVIAAAPDHPAVRTPNPNAELRREPR